MRIFSLLLVALVLFPDLTGAQSTAVFGKRRHILQTGPDNSLEQAAGIFKLRSRRKGTAITTISTDTNIHGHSRRPVLRNLKNYEYTGQMKIADENGGIGITFNSDYPNSDSYYRLRRYSGWSSFHIAPHGTDITAGEVDTGVIPEPGAWYKFRVRTQNQGQKTLVKAKVWKLGQKEPRAWQADCEDSSETRSSSGKVGIWGMGEGEKLWLKLVVSNK